MMFRNISRLVRYINHHPLASKHKAKAYGNLLKWQIGQKLLPFPVEYPFIENSKILLKKGWAGGTGNIYAGLQDFSEMSFLLHFLSHGDVFADVGANIGSYSILASACKGAVSWAFEPVPATFEILQSNIYVNRMESNAFIHNCGIGSGPSRMYFTKNENTENHVLLNGSQSAISIEVAVDSLDNILGAANCPALIKIDVEGYEQEVIRGAGAILANKQLKAIIIELNGSGGRYGYSEKQIHEELGSFGFVPCNYEPFSRTLTTLDTFGAHNTIYVRNIDEVAEKLKKAPSFRVFSEDI